MGCRLMKQTIIRCDHCNKDITATYQSKQLKAEAIVSTLTCYNRREQNFGKTLELCDSCANEFKTMIMDWIQPKHYKH